MDNKQSESEVVKTQNSRSLSQAETHQMLLAKMKQAVSNSTMTNINKEVSGKEVNNFGDTPKDS